MGALASAYLTVTLDLTDGQSAALQPVIEILEAWHQDAVVLCDHSELKDVSAALTQLSEVVDQTQLRLAELRPAFDMFYASLSATQQETLNGWLHHHRADHP